MTNPLNSTAELPLFSQIQHEQIEPTIRELIAANHKTIDDLLKNQMPFTWENLMLPLENLDEDFREIWGLVKHLNSVRDNPFFRKAHDAVLPAVTEYFIEMSQNPKLYEAILSIRNNSSFENMDIKQKKVIENYLRDFKLTGVSLIGEDKDRFKALYKRLSEIRNKFEQNVLDATQNWFLLIDDEAQLNGLPIHTIKQAKAAAEENQQVGWRITLDYPCYQAVICYAENRELRKKMYFAYHTLASDQNSLDQKQWDNGPLIVEQLKLKEEISKLLGFQCYAEFSLAKKMLKKTSEVINFLYELIIPVKKQALRDADALKKMAKQEYNISEIQAWDVGFLTEKLLLENYAFSGEELRPYFPESQVIKGMFLVAGKLFNITIKEIKNFDAWHPSVKLFEIFDKDNQLRGRFYMDLYARSHKRKGAWCDSCKSRKERLDGSIQTPMAYIVANFRPAIAEEREAQLSHEEVITLFHEFGHCLHFILSNVNYPSIGPDRGVAWDAIELPSQLMENWCWEEEVIPFISRHCTSGEPLPPHLFSKLKESKNFLIGLSMMRQLEFSLFDFELHMKSSIQNYLAVQSILTKVREKTAIIPIPEFNRFPNTFSHIFAGGYGAGYYSYLWSEVLSADTYHFFKENNQIFDQSIAERYLHNILEPGGSKDFMDLYMEFRGRPPKVQALLKDWGL